MRPIIASCQTTTTPPWVVVGVTQKRDFDPYFLYFEGAKLIQSISRRMRVDSCVRDAWMGRSRSTTKRRAWWQQAVRYAAAEEGARVCLLKILITSELGFGLVSFVFWV
ncbi:hypothetical protein ES332_A01G121200v1 [Gossypium tomentosum]|uniref:Uncharacterized protein n=1 Tax=Gossypium tomentosum TaxID=34277 RepID=A0A5D2RS84_GOSTO|nr:hypothetical protein ES332_A01G121200v1 [Gossypium tomentosum]